MVDRKNCGRFREGDEKIEKIGKIGKIGEIGEIGEIGFNCLLGLLLTILSGRIKNDCHNDATVI